MHQAETEIQPLAKSVRAGLAILVLYALVFAGVCALGIHLNGMTEVSGVRLWRKLILAPALLALIWFDMREYRLPDLITLPLLASGLALTYLQDSSQLPLAVIAAMIGYGLIWGLNRLWSHFRGTPGIGLGDAKLLAAGGAWCGIGALPIILLASSGAGILLALIVTGASGRGKHIRQTLIPFGLVLAPSIWGVECLAPLI